MLGEALTALAAAGGTAVVQAAGTSGWQGFQRAVARWFARGDEDRERVVLERLDDDARALAAGDGDPRVRVSRQAAWQARFETVLEELDDEEREPAVEGLRALLGTYAAGATGDCGQTIGGDVSVRADHGSAAALRMGDVTIGSPPRPGPHQG